MTLKPWIVSLSLSCQRARRIANKFRCYLHPFDPWSSVFKLRYDPDFAAVFGASVFSSAAAKVTKMNACVTSRKRIQTLLLPLQGKQVKFGH